MNADMPPLDGRKPTHPQRVEDGPQLYEQEREALRRLGRTEDWLNRHVPSLEMQK